MSVGNIEGMALPLGLSLGISDKPDSELSVVSPTKLLGVEPAPDAWPMKGSNIEWCVLGVA